MAGCCALGGGRRCPRCCGDRLNLGRAARRLAERLVHCQRARSIGVFRKVDADGLFGQQLLDQFGPFEQADVAGVEVILIAHIVDFFQALYAVEIEMEDAPIGRCVVIFVDDGKGGRVDNVNDAHFLAEGFDERGFTDAHLTIKSEDGAVLHRGDEAARGLRQVGFRLYPDSSHISCVVWLCAMGFAALGM